MAFNQTSSPSSGSVYSPFTAWSVLDKAWVSINGCHADEFRFVPGDTPLSTLSETATVIILYLTTVFGGQELMRNRKPFRLDGLFKLYNLALSIASGALLILFLEQLVPTLWRDGFYENICGDDGWTDPLVVLYYLNYVTKYIELIDTVFLMLKKKPMTFLHCYHHPATALLCCFQLLGRTSVSWVPITLNLTVHVVMYWYYFQSARGVKVSWKQWITRLQIAQFVIDLCVVYFASWDYWASTHLPWLPHVGTCAGHPYAAISGCFILSSYLFLFVLFYIATYKKAGEKRRIKGQPEPRNVLKDAKNAIANGHIVN